MGNICVIGPRASGKTTYLAGLSYFSEYRGSRSEYSIEPLNDETHKLAEDADQTICNGLAVEPTVLGDRIRSVDDLPDYSFKIEVKQRFLRPRIDIQLTVRDYPGEVFDKILHSSPDPIMEEFIDECFRADVDGCLLLFTEWESSRDRFYSQLIKQFLKIMDEHDRLNNYRLAVAMSKCERGEIWPGRLDPETDLFGIYLKKTLKTLKKSVPPKNLQFYAMSTFGVSGRYDPRPNRADARGTNGRVSILREPNRWQPYNLVEPLCWLSTGQI
ncbi:MULTISPECIES: hypothetical protein [Limnospira]|uniref:Uncharacterized protein n=2 Tax=Limnospira TaxID=2596745 RepID=A0A9P1NZW3_9CYAN|nr:MULTISPECIES: hypothetical protein [Limnospira]EKD07460.1 hypothetical protein SPLC1_S411270 [Arthrospira platensis C1]MDC0839233.1 hypothetical protein [Limnoraphis robusta]MDY7052210.1 hypothetical protein [Limnospira fusiformis LS22]QJB25786.1 hypothetical protein HFV01_08245 [Limnospira fusiformis SAG 85.79]EDZ92522.1 conserved hypothetical protein [Limnospira maxima CS-328]